MKRNPGTGRFESETKPTSEEINAIVKAFAEATAPEMPPIPAVGRGRLRWAVAFGMATAVVAGCLIGAAAKDWELGPTIHSLKSQLAGAVDTGAALAESSIDLRKQVGELQEMNTRLLLERGGTMQAIGEYRATDKAAVRDLRRADSALQYDQSVDRVSDRATTWMALRAVERAERRLKGQP